MTVLSASQIEALAEKAGFTGISAVTATAIALAESGGNTTATHLNSNGSIDYGLWQINSIHGYDPQSLLIPDFNAKAAYAISSGGTDFQPWATYNTGRYQSFMSQVGQAAHPAIPASTSVSGNSMLSQWISNPVRIAKLFAGIGCIILAIIGIAEPDIVNTAVKAINP